MFVWTPSKSTQRPAGLWPHCGAGLVTSAEKALGGFKEALQPSASATPLSTAHRGDQKRNRNGAQSLQGRPAGLSGPADMSLRIKRNTVPSPEPRGPFLLLTCETQDSHSCPVLARGERKRYQRKKSDSSDCCSLSSSFASTCC